LFCFVEPLHMSFRLCLLLIVLSVLPQFTASDYLPLVSSNSSCSFVVVYIIHRYCLMFDRGSVRILEEQILVYIKPCWKANK